MGDVITCTASLSDGGESSEYVTSFSTSGLKTVRLAMHHAGGSESASITVVVLTPPPIEEPRIGLGQRVLVQQLNLPQALAEHDE